MNIKDIIPIPDLNEMSAKVESDLTASNSKITNFRVGRIFKTLIMIFLQAVVDLYKLVANVVSQVFLTKDGAKGPWLDLKAKELGIERKQASKTEGLVAVSRNESNGTPVMIPQGTIFKTTLDADGSELRFITTEKVIMQQEELKVYVPVVAELPGAGYNVPANMIKNSFQHISGIDTINNEADWLTKEGTDTETDDALLERCENVWNELSTNLTASAYASKIAKLDGVLIVQVDDLHPRGQGTVDIIITGTAGIPTPALIQTVQNEVEKIKGPYDNVIVYGPEAIYQDVDVTLYINRLYGDEDLIRAEAIGKINSLFMVTKESPGNHLYRAEITSKLMPIENTTNVIVNTPVEDVTLNPRQLIMPGTITVNIIREGA